ncbi:hypothetical protein LCGC14_1819360 [marine sediment metagenome]|uniref:Homing endonuclease LAGLIDADG domain-containing protein n=1 Tax=marine sediment metagenome TaxID=412755 RepID=A0A0F9H7J6_9ZZZZ
MKAPIDQVCELYGSGLSQNEVARQLGCSRSLVDKVMRENKIRSRSFVEACTNRIEVSDELRQTVVDAYVSGIPFPDILVVHSVTEKVLRRLLRGVRRSISESNRVVTQRRKHNLSQEQLDLIYGTLLGDASLVVDGHSITYSTSHCDRQRGYIDHIRSTIGHGSVSSVVQKSGFSPGSIYHHFHYRNKGALRDIWDVVMVGGKKTVNPKWVKRLTPAAVAYWFMDDGSSVWVGVRKNYVRISFATYSFSHKEVELLCGKLHHFGLKASIDLSTSSRHGTGLSVRISQSDSLRFMRMVNPTVQLVSCMAYKLKYPDYRRDSFLHMG